MTKNNITTIEGLAEMLQRTMASKEDMTEVKKDMKAMEGRLTTRLDHLDARVGRIEADVHALRDEMVHRHDCEDVRDRVTSIEKKLGIESGV
jgi:DNA-binding FrmR family transcriptional regulator